MIYNENTEKKYTHKGVQANIIFRMFEYDEGAMDEFMDKYLGAQLYSNRKRRSWNDTKPTKEDYQILESYRSGLSISAVAEKHGKSIYKVTAIANLVAQYEYGLTLKN